jgi:serine/threonine protein kinase
MNDDEKTRRGHHPGNSDDSFDTQETSSLESLTRGMEFGRYKIVHRIGSGGMGTVYCAFDPFLDRKVALKVLHDKVASLDTEQRLLREAQAMARLNHPNVVTVHDVGMEDGRPFVAMEYVVGFDLRTWLQRDKPGWREIIDKFSAAGEGLAAAHAAGLVHRDFKPGNVMVGDDGRIKVTDFGLARAAEGDWETRGTSPGPVTVPMGDAESSSPLDTPARRPTWPRSRRSRVRPITVRTSTPFAFRSTSPFSASILWARSLPFPTSSCSWRVTSSARPRRTTSFRTASSPPS